MEKLKKQTYEVEERLFEYSVRITKYVILEETEEFKLQSGATSLFDVQRWTFDVRRSALETSPQSQACAIHRTKNFRDPD